MHEDYPDIFKFSSPVSDVEAFTSFGVPKWVTMSFQYHFSVNEYDYLCALKPKKHEKNFINDGWSAGAPRSILFSLQVRDC